ncbi:MAG: glycine dehydrogenase, partial [bacterium]
QPFFKEFAVRFPAIPARIVEHLHRHGIFAGVPLDHFGMGMDDLLLVAVTEQRTKEEMNAYVEAVREIISN